MKTFQNVDLVRRCCLELCLRQFERQESISGVSPLVVVMIRSEASSIAAVNPAGLPFSQHSQQPLIAKTESYTDENRKVGIVIDWKVVGRCWKREGNRPR